MAHQTDKFHCLNLESEWNVEQWQQWSCFVNNSSQKISAFFVRKLFIRKWFTNHTKQRTRNRNQSKYHCGQWVLVMLDKFIYITTICAKLWENPYTSSLLVQLVKKLHINNNICTYQTVDIAKIVKNIEKTSKSQEHPIPSKK